MKIFYRLFTSILIFLLVSIFAISCSNAGKNRKPVLSDKEMEDLREPLVRVNRNLTEQDEIRITKHTERMAWAMQKTKTGLRYSILENGNGDSISDGSKVSLNYELSVLGHGIVYTSDSLGMKSFIVNGSDIEEGLNEAVQLMTYGTKARIIIPPHLGFGLRGDDWRIPSRAILIYEIEVLP